jgi:hypothetical protein
VPVSNADRDVYAQARFTGERKNRYPKPNMNEEGNFQSWETRDQDLYEIPTATEKSFDCNKRTTSAAKLKARADTLHPNDRKTVTRNPPNDPGVFRAIATVDENGKPTSTPGLLYHPEGESQLLRRAALEPLSRRGRQLRNQCADRYDDNANRSETWPARDEDAGVIADMERNYRIDPRRLPGCQERQKQRRIGQQ